MRRQAHEQADTPAPHRQIRTLTSEATSQSKWQHKHTPPTDAAHRLRHHPPSNTHIMSHPPKNTQTPSAHTPHAQTSQNPSGGLVKRAYSVWTRIRAQRARHQCTQRSIAPPSSTSPNFQNSGSQCSERKEGGGERRQSRKAELQLHLASRGLSPVGVSG